MQSFLVFLFFLIPIVWCRYVNANYLTTKTFFMYFVASLVLLALPKKINFKKIPLTLLIPLVLISIYHIGYYFTESNWGSVFYIFKMLSFASLSLYFYSVDFKLNQFFNKLTYPFFIMWGVIFALTCTEIFQLRVLDQNIKTDIILSTFGNINMFAEFLILTLPLFYVWLKHRDEIPEKVKVLFFFIYIFLILYGRSRSAWMGLALWAGFQFFRGFTKKEYIAMGAAVLLFAVSHFTAPTDTTKISKLTSQSFTERSSLYKASFELLRDRPTGIPIGQFMNEIVPYLMDKEQGPAEYAYFDQPHCEILKWGIQFGWGFLFLCCSFLALLVYELYRKYKNDKTDQKSESTFFIQSFLVLIPQLCFQFPFENPASILILALVFGLFLSSYDQVRALSIEWLHPIFGVLAFAGLVNSFMFISSVYFESTYSISPDIMNVICKNYPVSFKTCNFKNQDLLQTKNIQGFKTEFKKDFKDNPFYCDNLRLLPEYFNYSQNARKTCEALLLYKTIYKDQKQFLPQAYEQCSSYSAPFKFESAEQFSRDFKKWFESN